MGANNEVNGRNPLRLLNRISNAGVTLWNELIQNSRGDLKNDVFLAETGG